MKWILQENLISKEQVTGFEDVFIKHNIPFERVTVIPFTDNVDVKSKDPVKIPYGSTRMSTFAYENKWKGMFFNENFKTSIWIKEREDMLNSDAHFFTVHEAMVAMLHEDEREWFIRPDNDLKEFAGCKRMTSEFVDWVDRMSGANGNLLNDDTDIVVAPVKNITAEWRWFIVNGEVIDGSLYRLMGRLRKEHEGDIDIINEAQGLADIWLPHETCVMDTALVKGELKVIEFNCLNASGFYDHDLEKIILAITNHVKGMTDE